jgi:VanZ family protein
MLTPNHVVKLARIALVGGAVTAAVLMLGPWPGLEQAFGLSDKAAHAIAFGGLTALSFVAFPRMRRNDLALAAILLGASIEVAQLFATQRSASFGDLGADALGVAIIHFASHIESFRSTARKRGYFTFDEIAQQDRRRRRSRRPAIQPGLQAPETVEATAAAQTSFAARAARQYPRRA